MDALKATGLCRAYGTGKLKTQVLDGFDLTLAPGGFLWLLCDFNEETENK